MAKWRALHGDISTSEQVMDLTEFEQLLFTWMIPHADDWGIMTGKPKGVKAKAIPSSERSLEEIDEALGHIEEARLIWRYEANGHGPLIQFKGWDDRQPIRKDRRKDGKYPDHAGQMPTNRLTNDGLDKTRLDKTILDKTRQDGCELYSNIWNTKMGQLVPGDQAERINDWMDRVPEDWIVAAMEICQDRGKYHWAYCEGVLRNAEAEKKKPGSSKHGARKGRELTDQQRAFEEAAERQQQANA